MSNIIFFRKYNKICFCKQANLLIILKHQPGRTGRDGRPGLFTKYSLLLPIFMYGNTSFSKLIYLFNMNTIAVQLKAVIDQHFPSLREIPDDQLIFKPLPEKWSKKEIIGHLVDSAQSNIRRFIAAQYEDSPYIVYNQDKWVSINNYQQWPSEDIIHLWYLLNKQVCAIWKNTPWELAQRECRTQELHTIEWLALDYIKHLRHHLHQVLDLEPVAYP